MALPNQGQEKKETDRKQALPAAAVRDEELEINLVLRDRVYVYQLAHSVIRETEISADET